MNPAAGVSATPAAARTHVSAGRCKVAGAGASVREYRTGLSFSVPVQSSIMIEALEPMHYVRQFG